MAPPRIDEFTELHDENDLIDSTSSVQGVSKLPDKDYKNEIVWKNVILMGALNIASVYGLYLYYFKISWSTLIWILTYRNLGGLGVTAGTHRLWTHRSYKAKLPLRIILMLLNSTAGQNSIYEWVRDHRMHHKYSETNADPHNASRGFFFSHVGWLLVKKHPDVIAKGKYLEMSDLEADGVVTFQKKYYPLIGTFMCFVLPTIVPVYLFGETWHNAIFVCALYSYCQSLHFTWLVNSLAHMMGNKPYDKYISPSENLIVSMLVLGEGWHNYHHVFPWDYKTSELGFYWGNGTTAFIDFFAKLGQAYDLKYANPELVKKRIERTGDGSHFLWGWSDRNITKEDVDCTVITRVCKPVKNKTG